MTAKTFTLSFRLSIIAAMLIILNGLWIAANGGPLVIFSSSISSIETLTGANAPSWWRISFGLPGLIGGGWIALWLILAVINLFSAMWLYTNPTNYSLWSLIVLACSILSIPIGGGFLIGLILGVVGGGMGTEWPKPPGKTFIGNLLKAAKLDSKFFEKIGKDSHALKSAALTIVFVNILSGFGNGLYLYNIEQVTKPPSPDIPFRILLLGDMLWNTAGVAGGVLSLVGVALIKWLILSGLIYLVGVKIAGRKAELDQIGRIVAFAYTPVCLQFFMPFILGSESILTFQWPLAAFFFTNIWFVIALIVGLRQSLDMGTQRTVGVVLLAGIFYWVINYTFLIPTLEIPSIHFAIEPPGVMLILISAAGILATLLGVFSRK